jgi:hypothetical protein
MGLGKFCEKFLDALFATARWLERIIVISYPFGAAHNPKRAALVGGNHEYEALPDDSCGCCDPLRTRLSAYPSTGILILQRLRGATRRLKSAVLRCGSIGVGTDRVVCEGFSGLARGARRSNASVVGLAVDIVINVWATLLGWLNANTWGSTVVLALLLLGGAYQLSIGARKTA